MSPDPQVPGPTLSPRWQPAVAVGLAAAAALALLLGTTGGSGWTGVPDGAPPPAAAAPDRVPAPVPTGGATPRASTAPPTLAPTPAPISTTVPAPAALAQTRPEPFVQNFASGTAAGTAPPVPSPTAPITMPPGVDGCDHGYGTVTQCVPWQFPPGVTDGCAWLLDRDYGPLEVHGDDRHNLDRNGDGIACGPGD